MVFGRRHRRDPGIRVCVSGDVERSGVTQNVILRRLLRGTDNAVAVTNVAAAVLGAFVQESGLHELAEPRSSLSLDVPTPSIVSRHSGKFLKLRRCQPTAAMLNASAFATRPEPGRVQHALHGPAEDLHRVVRSSRRHPGPDPGIRNKTRYKVMEGGLTTTQ
jgi:hypothetical protein